MYLSFQLPKHKSPLLLLFQKSIIIVINYIKLFTPLIVSFSFVHAPECAYCTPFYVTYFSFLLYFTLTKDGVNIIVYMLCISKTACFSVNCAPLSLQFGRNEEPKGSNGSCPSECDYQTPPSQSDTAPFWCAKPQPIRGFPTIGPMTF